TLPFFRNKENRLAVVYRGRNDVRNSLRFTCTGRSLDYKVTSASSLLNYNRLRTIGVNDTGAFGKIDAFVDRLIVGDKRRKSVKVVILTKEYIEERVAEAVASKSRHIINFENVKKPSHAASRSTSHRDCRLTSLLTLSK